MKRVLFGSSVFAALTFWTFLRRTSQFDVFGLCCECDYDDDDDDDEFYDHRIKVEKY